MEQPALRLTQGGEQGRTTKGGESPLLEITEHVSFMLLLRIQMNKIVNYPHLLGFFILFLITFSLMLPCSLLKIKHFLFVPQALCQAVSQPDLQVCTSNRKGGQPSRRWRDPYINPSSIHYATTGVFQQSLKIAATEKRVGQ